MAARLKERASAPAMVRRCTSSGVSSRASKPKTSRRGEKVPPTGGTVPHGLLDGQGTVDGGHRPSPGDRFASGATGRTLGPGGCPGGDLAHLSGLDLATELLTELVGAGFDDRVM